jgi:hypothetical protein
MWCWRRTEKVRRVDHLKNELLLHRIKDSNNLCIIKRRKANWIGHIVRRNCLLKHISEGKRDGRIKVMERRGRRCKQLLDDLKEGEDTGN